jgi:hypothetical protein
MSAIRPLLREFVDWLESCYVRRGPCGSPFEAQVEPALVAKTGIALDRALVCQKPVELFTTTINPKPLIAALILQRSGVDLESVFRDELEDRAFPRLIGCLVQIAKSQFRLIPGPPPAAVAQSAFFGGPLFAVFKT